MVMSGYTSLHASAHSVVSVWGTMENARLEYDGPNSRARKSTGSLSCPNCFGPILLFFQPCYLVRHIPVLHNWSPPSSLLKQAVGGRPPRYAPPRPATEARSGSLEPGRPSRARSANMRYPAGRQHTPPACTWQTSDRQMSDSIIAQCALGGGITILYAPRQGIRC